MRASRPAALQRRHSRERLRQRLRRAARLGGDDESRSVQIERAERQFQRDRIEVVVEAGARTVPLRLVGEARDVPAAELRQRLAAEARAARAEEDDGARADAEFGERGLGRNDVGLVFGDAQQRQAPLAVVALQSVERRSQPLDPQRQLVLAQAMLADCAVEAAGNRMGVGDRAGPLGNRGVHARGLARIRALSSGGTTCPLPSGRGREAMTYGRVHDRDVKRNVRWRGCKSFGLTGEGGVSHKQVPSSALRAPSPQGRRDTACAVRPAH